MAGGQQARPRVKGFLVQTTSTAMYATVKLHCKCIHLYYVGIHAYYMIMLSNEKKKKKPTAKKPSKFHRPYLSHNGHVTNHVDNNAIVVRLCRLYDAKIVVGALGIENFVGLRWQSAPVLCL